MRNTYVPPSGPTDAKLAMCGEQPGYQEIRGGRPFIGPAGEELNNCFQLVPLNRQDIYLTNVIKDLDAPLEHYADTESMTFSPDGYKYVEELKQELTALKPNVVVAIGNVALMALCSRVGITKWRGSILESTLIPGLKVVPCIHPATVIPPKNVYLNKWLIIHDLKRAKEQSEFPEILITPRKVMVLKSRREAVSHLSYLYEQGLKGAIIDFDIEIVGEEVTCFAVSESDVEAACIPFVSSHGDMLSIEDESDIMVALARILEEPRIAKRGANFIFDLSFMLQRYGIKPQGDIHCTQIAERISFPDYPAALHFVTSMHTDIPYYKDDGKKWMKVGGAYETFWNYNAYDTLATASAHPSQIIDLEIQGNTTTYDRQRRLIPVLLYMSAKGIKVDAEGILKEKERTVKLISETQSKLDSKLGFHLDINSPKQVMEYFYKHLGLKPYKKRNSKGKFVDTSDVTAMKRLARRGYEEARLILDLRGYGKRLSTYLSLDKIDSDGRFRTAYKPDGAETGRLSSGETIFGTGGNQQNWPHDLLRYFLFDEGYIGYSLDKSQIENRIVAYVGEVTQMIEAFESGKDVHRLTASMIFEKAYDQVSDKDGSSDLGDGRQSERFWGKKANHALNYDEGYKQFALLYELPESQAQWMVEKYHSAYPGVRYNYHAGIISQLNKDRTIINLLGRRRIFMGPIHGRGADKTYKEAYAHIPQSSTADLINEFGLEYVYFNQDLFRQVELLAQIHDSIVFQIPLSVPWIEHARILTLIKNNLDLPFDWKGRKFIVPTDTAIGLNMCKEEMVEIKAKNFPSSETELAHKLEEIYGRLRTNSQRLD